MGERGGVKETERKRGGGGGRERERMGEKGGSERN